MHTFLIGGEVCGAGMAIAAAAKGTARLISWGANVLRVLASIDQRFATEASARAEDRKTLHDHGRRIGALERAGRPL